MNHKTLYTVFLICAIIFSGATGFASTGGAPTENSPNIVPGQPGTVFRYEQTFGKNGVAYLADNSHLYHPVGVILDGSGNLWVAESYGARVMKFKQDGTFLMSIGTAGLTFLADETHFTAPIDINVDSDGNVWVADGESARVVEFDSTGSYLTQLGVALEGGSDNNHFDGPADVAFDHAKNIYITDSRNHRIQVFDSSGAYSTTLGVTGEPGADNDHFNNPLRIAIDEDDALYVVDTSNDRVQIFDASHTYSATLGVTEVPGSDNGHFDSPRGIAVDASYIYVTDANNHRVQIFDRATGTHQDTLGETGVAGSDNYHFDTPRGIAVDSSGNLYVADAENHRVQKYDSSLVYVRTFGVTGVPYLTDAYHYNQPNKVAVDANGNIGILEDEGRGHRFIKLDASGAPQFTIGEPGVWGDDNDHFSDARGVAFDANGDIYVGDCANHRVQIFSSAGVYSATLGAGEGQGNNQFSCPTGVAFDSKGNLYVADSTNQRIQIFDSNLVYSETLGETGVPGDDNDHFRWPRDVAVDAKGNIYVADTFNERVQKFDSSHAWKMTLGVTGECGYDFDHFCTPMGLAVDGAGNVYVSEWWSLGGPEQPVPPSPRGGRGYCRQRLHRRYAESPRSEVRPGRTQLAAGQPQRFWGALHYGHYGPRTVQRAALRRDFQPGSRGTDLPQQRRHQLERGQRARLWGPVHEHDPGDHRPGGLRRAALCRRRLGWRPGPGLALARRHHMGAGDQWRFRRRGQHRYNCICDIQ